MSVFNESFFENKAVRASAYAVLISAVIFVVVMAWLIFYPVGGGSTVNSITVPDTVTAGEIVHINVDYCKTTEGKAESNYSLVTESQVFYAPPIVTSRPVGCDIATLELMIPVTAQPGRAHYELDVFRQFNPLNSGITSGRSNDFTIVAPPSDED